MKPKNLTLNRLALAGAVLFTVATINVSARDTDIYFTDPSASGLKPNVQLILDTSGSMNEYVSDGMSRIDQMKQAMKTIIDESTDINMGVMRFSRAEGAAVIYPLADLDATVTDSGNLIAAMQNQSDDAEESGGVVTTTSTDYDFIPGNVVGVRFMNVYIPRGATITSAKLTFTADATQSTATNITISADDHDDAPTFSAVNNDITGRTQTASVAWNGVANWNSGTRYYSPDISTVLQTVVNRAGWCNGNAMAFRLTTASGGRTGRAYDRYAPVSGVYENYNPKLVVTYTPPAIGTITTCNKTVVSRVRLGSDDAEQNVSTGGMTTAQTSSNPIQLTKQGASNEQYIGVRFQNIAVPQGATIVSAELEFRVRTTNAAAASLTVYGEAADNPGTFLSTSNNIWSRLKTTASVAWNSLPNPAAGQALKTPDVKTIVQEIVNRGSWADGNAMAFLIQAQGASSGPRNVEAYETAPGKAPFLRIVYQATTDTTRTVRDELKAAIVAMTAGGSTPIVDALYEGALYFRGDTVDYGKVRENAGTLTHLLRVSHPLTYSGGSLSQPVGCTNADLEANACQNEQITGSPTYISPVTAGCQSNHMVLLTDGAATANNSQAKVRAMAGASSCSGSGSEACGVTLVQYLAENDQFTGYSGTQPIITHTIGFNFSSQFLQDLATYGKGTFNTADNADELVTAFQAIINQVLSDPTGFVSPSLAVNAFNRLYNQDDVYFSLFSPQLAIGWPGNVKKYRLCDTGEPCPFGEVMDANSVAAIDSSTSKIKTTAQSYWSGSVDGPIVDQGGAGSQIPTYSSRNVYTYTGTSDVPASPVDLSTASHVVTNANAAITQPMLGAGSAAERTTIINWMRGQDVQDDDSDGSTTDDRWKFADALHSRPITVTYGGTAASPVTKLFVGTNDGGLRMINSSTGVEEWIVYLPEFLDDMKTLMDNNSGTHFIGTDGAPSVWVVDNDNDGIIEPGGSDNDKVYLYIGMRRGGRDIYAFDVTPTSTLSSPSATGGITPKFLWRIKGGAAGEFAGLGETWSRPRVATIRIKCASGDTSCDDGVSATPDSKNKTVLIFGGGYDPGQDNAFPAGADAMGNGIYIVDPLNGSLVWRAGGTSSTAPLELSAMKYAIASDVALLDSNGDDAIDRLYVGDTRGQVFRIDLGDQIDPSAGTPALKNGGSSGYVFADTGCTGGVRSNDCTATLKYDRRKFFYMPTLVQARDSTYSATADYDLVAIESGDREDPLDKLTQALSVDPVHNRIYAFRDYNYRFGAPSPTPAVLTESDLYNSTTNELQDPSGPGYAAALTAIAAADGWYVELKETTAPNWVGEKGLAEITVFSGVLYATTYIPPSGAVVAPGTCPPPAEGTARLYGLNYLSGAGVVDLDNSGYGIDRYVEVGGGIPSGMVVIIREGGATGLVGTSGGGAYGSGGSGGDCNGAQGKFCVKNSSGTVPTFWYDE